jgi:hypothetical protein
MKLFELQGLFQASVLAEAPAPELLAQFRAPARAESISETFAIYRDGFRLRMGEFLTHDYPVLSAALGEAAFEALVDAYWRAQPSRFRSARWFGAGLPEFLRATPPWRDDGFVCGLAALEEALARSFDAEDAPELGIGCLGAMSAEEWPRLRLGFHPGAILVETETGALTAYEQAQEGASPSEPCAGENLRLLVWRRELEVQYRALDAGEAMALAEAMGGAPFAEICALLAFAGADAQEVETAQAAGALLARWFADGLIVTALPTPD